MPSRDDQISADRLFEASEAVLRAVQQTSVSIAGTRKTKAPYPPDLMGRANQPACLSTFSKDEVEQATAFLIRSGYYKGPKPKQ